MKTALTIPALDDESVLRHVTFEGGYRLLTWDLGVEQSWTSHHRVGFALYEPGIEEPLFLNYMGVPRHSSIDDDKSLHSVVGWCLLKPGDTDAEFFADYTERQLAWVNAHAEEMYEWGADESHFEEGKRTYPDYERPQFIEIPL